MGQLLLGIDVGTYSSKGVLVEPDGTVLKSHVVDHEMAIPHPGWAEQDADAVWWGDVVKICHALLDGQPYRGEDVGGVALSAIGPCMLPLDAQGRPLRPGILYGVDTRAAKEIETLTGKLGEDTVYDFSGMVFTSQAVGPKILWMKVNEPDLWRRVEHITTASSYLIYRLTGEKVIDRHTASHYMPLMDIRTLEWSDRFADGLVGLDRLPRLGWSDELAGRVNRAGAAETGLTVGTPVAVGAVDALSEGVSVGAVQPGDLMIMYGSTAFFILVLDAPHPDKRMWTVAGAFKGQYALAAGMATTGSLTRWFRDELAADLPADTAYNTLFAEAEAVEPGSGGLIVLPYFSGERTPINDPQARGVIMGLTLAHTRKHLYRAVLESVAYGIRHNIETFNSIPQEGVRRSPRGAKTPVRAASTGPPGRDGQRGSTYGAGVKRVVAVGGGTKSTTWLQIVSDVSGISQTVPALTIGASYGDAFLAGLAAGVLKREDLQTWVKPGMTVVPNPQRKPLYDRYYADYLALYERTKDIMHRLSG